MLVGPRAGGACPSARRTRAASTRERARRSGASSAQVRAERRAQLRDRGRRSCASSLPRTADARRRIRSREPAHVPGHPALQQPSVERRSQRTRERQRAERHQRLRPRAPSTSANPGDQAARPRAARRRVRCQPRCEQRRAAPKRGIRRRARPRTARRRPSDPDRGTARPSSASGQRFRTSPRFSWRAT